MLLARSDRATHADTLALLERSDGSRATLTTTETGLAIWCTDDILYGELSRSGRDDRQGCDDREETHACGKRENVTRVVRPPGTEFGWLGKGSGYSGMGKGQSEYFVDAWSCRLVFQTQGVPCYIPGTRGTEGLKRTLEGSLDRVAAQSRNRKARRHSSIERVLIRTSAFTD